MTKRVIVYHDDCHDGITALWVCLRKWPDAEAYPALHYTAPDLERLRGADVVMVDFAWPRAELLQIHEVAASLLVLDHHKTSQADLEGLDFAIFDMERSGAGLAWDHLFPGQPRPALVDYVEDRDLWRFRLPDCREVHQACNAYPLTIEHRGMLMDIPIDVLAEEGQAILRYHDKLVASAARWATRETIAGYDVPSIVCPNIELISDLAMKLAVGEPFAAVRLPQPEGGFKVSLRSTDDGLDVGEIARQLGGGGHVHASGFPDLP